jgi:hypothetical protein
VSQPTAHAAPKIPPTTEQFGNLQAAYDYFNTELFDGKLSPCMLLFGRDQKNCYGYFHAHQWTTGKKDKQGRPIMCHTISLTPTHLSRPLVDVFSTLVHEMCRLWQADESKLPKNGYHNKEWAEKMKSVGLYPSSTGKPGGKEVGPRVSHYIVDGGPYANAFKKLPKDVTLAWLGVQTPKKEKALRNKVKYVCPECDMKVWGKPECNVQCGDCNVPMLEPV